MTQPPKNILVAQTNYLGDLLLTLPLLTALRARFPSAGIDILVQKELSDLVALHPAVREVLSMDKSGEHRTVRGFFRLVRTVRATKYDLAIVLPGSIRTALVTLFARIPRRIGWEPGTALSGQMKHVRFPSAMRTLPYVRGILSFEYVFRASRPLRKFFPPLFTVTLESRPGEHVAQRRLGTMLALGSPVSGEISAPWLQIPETVRVNIAARYPSCTNGRAVLAPGATQPTRCWPEEHFARLARLLAADRYAVYILGGVTEKDLSERIARAAGSPNVVSVAGKLAIVESMELIRQSVVVVANDSAPVHMASAMGTPTVALFGPTLPSFGFAPLAPGSRVIERSGLSCRPCTVYGSSYCPVGTHECLRSITVEEVRAAIAETILDKSDRHV